MLKLLEKAQAAEIRAKKEKDEAIKTQIQATKDKDIAVQEKKEAEIAKQELEKNKQ